MKTKRKPRVVWVACSADRKSDLAWPSRKWILESDLLQDLKAETGQVWKPVRFVEAKPKRKAK